MKNVLLMILVFWGIGFFFSIVIMSVYSLYIWGYKFWCIIAIIFWIYVFFQIAKGVWEGLRS